MTSGRTYNGYQIPPAGSYPGSSAPPPPLPPRIPHDETNAPSQTQLRSSPKPQVYQAYSLPQPYQAQQQSHLPYPHTPAGPGPAQSHLQFPIPKTNCSARSPQPPPKLPTSAIVRVPPLDAPLSGAENAPIPVPPASEAPIPVLSLASRPEDAPIPVYPVKGGPENAPIPLPVSIYNNEPIPIAPSSFDTGPIPLTPTSYPSAPIPTNTLPQPYPLPYPVDIDQKLYEEGIITTDVPPNLPPRPPRPESYANSNQQSWPAASIDERPSEGERTDSIASTGSLGTSITPQPSSLARGSDPSLIAAETETEELKPYPQADNDAMGIWQACDKLFADKKSIISILAHREGYQIAQISKSFPSVSNGKELIPTVVKKAKAIPGLTGSGLATALHAICLGPVNSEAYWVHKAVKGMGTKDALLTEAIFGRSEAELAQMKKFYLATYSSDKDKNKMTLEKAVSGDLSFDTRRLFEAFTVDANRPDNSVPVPLVRVSEDVTAILKAMELKISGRDTLAAARILVNSTPDHLRAIAAEYESRTKQSLRDLIQKRYGGHMKNTLLYILDGVMDKAKRDADLIEETMKGVGTDDTMLVSRLVRIHWDREHLTKVKAAYQEKYGKALVEKLQKNTGGDLKELAVALVSDEF